MLSRFTLLLLILSTSSILFGQQQIRTANFIANNSTVYPITGSVEFVKEEDGTQTVNFKNDFATVQGITLEVFLSTDADYDAADDFKISDDPIGMGVAMGIAITGPRSFVVPPEVDIATYDYVIVQCTTASTLWGYAELSSLDTNMSTNTWTMVDVDEGEKPTLQCDKNGIPHIAYMNESTTSGWTRIAELDGNSFSSELVSEGYFYGPLDLAFNNANRALIAYHDHDEAGGEFALARELATDNFEIEFIASTGHDGWDNKIVVEANDAIHVLSTDSGSGEVEYAFENNGSWQVEDAGIDGITYKWAVDLAVNDDVVYAVAYQSQTTGNLVMSTRENNTWSTEIVTEGGRYPSLSVDESGDILVAYYKRINAVSGYVEVAHRGTVGWEFSIVDTLKNHDSGNARDVVELLRNSSGTYIAYSDSDVLKLATANGDNWDVETVLDAKAQSMTLRNQTSMDIDDEGYFHFSTYRAEAGATANGRVMYITNKTLTDGGGMMQAQMITKNISFDIQDSQGNDLPMADLVVTSSDGETTISQMAFGQYALEALETSEDQIQVCVSLNTPAIDELSSVDVVRGLRIVLGLVDPCPVNVIAADVDESGSVSSVDLVQMINVLIGKNEAYSNNPSWVFMINGELNTCETFNLSTLPSTLDITGIKKGNIECEDTPINLQGNDENTIHWKK